MTLRIGLIGARGKMGQRILSCASKDETISLIWKLESQSSRHDLPKVDVIIDFSSPKALLANLTLAEDTKTPIVIGTTGLQQKEKQALEKAALSIPVFWAPNFSLGMAILVHAIKNLSPLLQKKFTPHITETHHIHKKDSPSGSAIALAEATQTGYLEAPSIQSLRLGESIGEHSITFLTEDEKITFQHEALSRDVFALGALRAAKFLFNKQPKLYSMQDLL